MNIDAALDTYVEAFRELTPDGLGDLVLLTAPDVRFKDPFNDVRGQGLFAAVFRHMFATLEDPRFAVTDRAVSGRNGYLRWTFTFRPKGRRETWTVEGMTEVRFDGAGRVAEHIDHWDAAEQFYEKLPVIGALMRMVKRRVSA
jgi:hypothetical protein